MTNHTTLTDSTEETKLESLMSSGAIFAIPYFQRPYKWKPERVRQLHSDILDLVDRLNNLHFLGAIITYGHKTNSSGVRIFEVIDGQQRITTVFLYICAAVKELCSIGKYSEAKQIFFKYLLSKKDNRTTGSNVRVQSCKEDRAQLNWVIKDLLKDKRFYKQLGHFSFRPLIEGGETKSGALRKNFQLICHILHEERKRDGVRRLRLILESLLQRVSVVEIELQDPTNGPKIFDSLNSRQEPMTIGELVRNEIFSRVSDESPARLTFLDENSWQPFYKKFNQKKNLFDAYFFPYGLIKNPNIKKSGVYSALRRSWGRAKTPEAVIDELAIYQDAFIDIETGSNTCGHSKEVALSFRRLYEAAAPSSVLPFLMQLSVAISRKKVPAQAAVKILNVIESFLVRRAVCGYEPTGLHAVFKRLWVDCGSIYTAARVCKEIAKHKTVTWPDDAEFADAIKTRPLYGAGVTKFVILQFDKSRKGDDPTEVPHMEHVLPNTLNSAWRKIFSTEQHAEMKDLLANLLPLRKAMNSSIGNRTFKIKSERFKNDAMFKSTREFATEFKNWTPRELDKRGRQLSNWALRRWPHTK